MPDNLIKQKLAQASGLLRELEIPLWIVQFGRETYDHPQPVQRLAVGTTITWLAAFIVTAGGESVAIVGTGDVANVEAVGAYDLVLGYVQDIGPDLRRILHHYDPDRVALSYSVDDDSADNLTHGMYLMLRSCLEETPYGERLVSAESALGALRARKLPGEVERIRAAIVTADQIFARIEELLLPGVTEWRVAQIVREWIAQAGCAPAWDPAYNPIVNFGPQAAVGHAGPGDVALEPGMLVHVDLGVKQEAYCSDLQRMWYLLRPDEESAPAEVLRPFETVLRSMQEGFRAVRPGVRGYEVDAVARRVIMDAGYPEPQFALGHQLGQQAHDGGALLGPRWPRYGKRPEERLEEGNVFTVEYGLPSPAGPIGLEEDIVVTANGAEYLSRPQTELQYLRG